jgi:hypothetical protein
MLTQLLAGVPTVKNEWLGEAVLDCPIYKAASQLKLARKNCGQLRSASQLRPQVTSPIRVALLSFKHLWLVLHPVLVEQSHCLFNVHLLVELELQRIVAYRISIMQRHQIMRPGVMLFAR